VTASGRFETGSEARSTRTAKLASLPYIVGVRQAASRPDLALFTGEKYTEAEPKNILMMD